LVPLDVPALTTSRQPPWVRSVPSEYGDHCWPTLPVAAAHADRVARGVQRVLVGQAQPRVVVFVAEILSLIQAFYEGVILGRPSVKGPRERTPGGGAFTVPNQLGMAYNARILATIARHIAPAIGWTPAGAGARAAS
jgi:hypothetical protein